MIKFWTEKGNRNWLQTTGGVVAISFLFTTVSAPFAQASIWQERKTAVEQMQKESKKSEEQYTQVASASNFQTVIGNGMLMPKGVSPELLESLSKTMIPSLQHKKSVKSKDLQLPSMLVNKIEQYGEIERVYLAEGQRVNLESENNRNKGFNLNTKLPLVIHIQDAHDIYSVQKNIAFLLKEFMEIGVNVVGVEGAEGVMEGIERWRKNPDKESLKEVGGYLLRKGMLSGVEAAGLGREKEQVEFYGVEKKEKYLDQVKSFKDTLGRNNEIKSWQDSNTLKISSLKTRIYSEDLKSLDRLKQKYEKGELKLGEWASALKEASIKAPREEDRDFSNVAKYLNAYHIEKEIDFKVVEKKQRELLEKLSQKLSQGELVELLQESLLYRLGNIGYGEFYSHLIERASLAGIELTPEIKRYIQYLLKVEGIDRERLFEELKDFSDKVFKEKINANPLMAEVYELDKDFSLMNKGLNFSLNVEEWQDYLKREKELTRIPEKVARLEGKNSQPEEQTQFQQVKEVLRNVEKFSRLSEERNGIFTHQLAERMKQKEEKISVLIAGGYHSAGIEESLKAKGISFITVRPRMDVSKVEKEYHPLNGFKRGLIPLEKMFMPEKVSLASLLASEYPDTAKGIGAEGALEQFTAVLSKLKGKKIAGSMEKIIHAEQVGEIYSAEINHNGKTIKVWTPIKSENKALNKKLLESPKETLTELKVLDGVDELEIGVAAEIGLEEGRVLVSGVKQAHVLARAAQFIKTIPAQYMQGAAALIVGIPAILLNNGFYAPNGFTLIDPAGFMLSVTQFLMNTHPFFILFIIILAAVAYLISIGHQDSTQYRVIGTKPVWDDEFHGGSALDFIMRMFRFLSVGALILTNLTACGNAFNLNLHDPLVKIEGKAEVNVNNNLNVDMSGNKIEVGTAINKEIVEKNDWKLTSADGRFIVSYVKDINSGLEYGYGELTILDTLTGKKRNIEWRGIIRQVSVLKKYVSFLVEHEPFEKDKADGYGPRVSIRTYSLIEGKQEYPVTFEFKRPSAIKNVYDFSSDEEYVVIHQLISGESQVDVRRLRDGASMRVIHQVLYRGKILLNASHMLFLKRKTGDYVVIQNQQGEMATYKLEQDGYLTKISDTSSLLPLPISNPTPAPVSVSPTPSPTVSPTPTLTAEERMIHDYGIEQIKLKSVSPNGEYTVYFVKYKNNGQYSTIILRNNGSIYKSVSSYTDSVSQIIFSPDSKYFEVIYFYPPVSAGYELYDANGVKIFSFPSDFQNIFPAQYNGYSWTGVSSLGTALRNKVVYLTFNHVYSEYVRGASPSHSHYEPRAYVKDFIKIKFGKDKTETVMPAEVGAISSTGKGVEITRELFNLEPITKVSYGPGANDENVAEDDYIGVYNKVRGNEYVTIDKPVSFSVINDENTPDLIYEIKDDQGKIYRKSIYGVESSLFRTQVLYPEQWMTDTDGQTKRLKEIKIRELNIVLKNVTQSGKFRVQWIEEILGAKIFDTLPGTAVQVGAATEKPSNSFLARAFPNFYRPAISNIRNFVSDSLLGFVGIPTMAAEMKSPRYEGRRFLIGELEVYERSNKKGRYLLIINPGQNIEMEYQLADGFKVKKIGSMGYGNMDLTLENVEDSDIKRTLMLNVASGKIRHEAKWDYSADKIGSQTRLLEVRAISGPAFIAKPAADSAKPQKVSLHKFLAILVGVGTVLADTLKNFMSHAMTTDASSSIVFHSLQTAPIGFGAILITLAAGMYLIWRRAQDSKPTESQYLSLDTIGGSQPDSYDEFLARFQQYKLSQNRVQAAQQGSLLDRVRRMFLSLSVVTLITIFLTGCGNAFNLNLHDPLVKIDAKADVKIENNVGINVGNKPDVDGWISVKSKDGRYETKYRNLWNSYHKYKHYEISVQDTQIGKTNKSGGAGTVEKILMAKDRVLMFNSYDEGNRRLILGMDLNEGPKRVLFELDTKKWNVMEALISYDEERLIILLANKDGAALHVRGTSQSSTFGDSVDVLIGNSPLRGTKYFSLGVGEGLEKGEDIINVRTDNSETIYYKLTKDSKLIKISDSSSQTPTPKPTPTPVYMSPTPNPSHSPISDTVSPTPSPTVNPNLALTVEEQMIQNFRIEKINLKSVSPNGEYTVYFVKYKDDGLYSIIILHKYGIINKLSSRADIATLINFSPNSESFGVIYSYPPVTYAYDLHEPHGNRIFSFPSDFQNTFPAKYNGYSWTGVNFLGITLGNKEVLVNFNHIYSEYVRGASPSHAHFTPAHYEKDLMKIKFGKYKNQTVVPAEIGGISSTGKGISLTREIENGNPITRVSYGPEANDENVAEDDYIGVYNKVRGNEFVVIDRQVSFFVTNDQASSQLIYEIKDDLGRVYRKPISGLSQGLVRTETLYPDEYLVDTKGNARRLRDMRVRELNLVARNAAHSGKFSVQGMEDILGTRLFDTLSGTPVETSAAIKESSSLLARAFPNFYRPMIASVRNFVSDSLLGFVGIPTMAAEMKGPRYEGRRFLIGELEVYERSNKKGRYLLIINPHQNIEMEYHLADGFRVKKIGSMGYGNMDLTLENVEDSNIKRTLMLNVASGKIRHEAKWDYSADKIGSQTRLLEVRAISGPAFIAKPAADSAKPQKTSGESKSKYSQPLDSAKGISALPVSIMTLIKNQDGQADSGFMIKLLKVFVILSLIYALAQCGIEPAQAATLSDTVSLSSQIGIWDGVNAISPLSYFVSNILLLSAALLAIGFMIGAILHLAISKDTQKQEMDKTLTRLAKLSAIFSALLLFSGSLAIAMPNSPNLLELSWILVALTIVGTYQKNIFKALKKFKLSFGILLAILLAACNISASNPNPVSSSQSLTNPVPTSLSEVASNVSPTDVPTSEHGGQVVPVIKTEIITEEPVVIVQTPNPTETINPTPNPSASVSPLTSVAPTPTSQTSPEITPTPIPTPQTSPEITPAPTPTSQTSPEVTPTPTPTSQTSPEITPTPRPSYMDMNTIARSPDGGIEISLKYVNDGMEIVLVHKEVSTGIEKEIPIGYRGTWAVKNNIQFSLDGKFAGVHVVNWASPNPYSGERYLILAQGNKVLDFQKDENGNELKINQVIFNPDHALIGYTPVIYKPYPEGSRPSGSGSVFLEYSYGEPSILQFPLIQDSDSNDPILLMNGSEFPNFYRLMVDSVRNFVSDSLLGFVGIPTMAAEMKSPRYKGHRFLIGELEVYERSNKKGRYLLIINPGQNIEMEYQLADGFRVKKIGSMGYGNMDLTLENVKDSDIKRTLMLNVASGKIRHEAKWDYSADKIGSQTRLLEVRAISGSAFIAKPAADSAKPQKVSSLSDRVITSIRDFFLGFVGKPTMAAEKNKSSNVSLHKSLAILAGVGTVLGDSLKNFMSHAMTTDASASAVLQPLQTAPAGFGAIILPVLGIVVPLVVGFIAYRWLTTPSLKVTKTLANVNAELDRLSRTLPYMSLEERDHALEPLAKDLKAIYSDKTIKRNFGNKEAIAESFGLAKSLGVDIADELGNHLRAKNVNVSDISIDRLFPEVRSNYLQDWIEFKRMEVSVDKTEFLQGLKDKLGLEKKKELGYQRFINAYSYGYAKGAVVQVPKERRVKAGNQSPNLGHGVRWIDVQDIHLAFVKQDVQDSLEQIEKEGLRGLLLIGKTQEELLKVLDERHQVILTQAMKNGKIRLLGKENVKNGIALDTIYRTTMKWGWKGVTVDFLTNDLNRLNESFAYANMIQTVLMTASGIKIVQGLVNDVSERALEHQVLVINQ